MRKHFVAHISAIDERVEIASVGKRSRRSAQETVHSDFSLTSIKCRHALRHIAPEHLVQSVPGVLDRHVVGDISPVVLQSEMHAGISQCQPVHGIANVAQLGCRRFQKFAPRRGIEEYISDLNGRPKRSCRGNNPFLLSAAHEQSIGARRTRRSRKDLHPGDRSNTRQSLAAKTKSRNSKQILFIVEFAGRMAFDRPIEIFRRHSFAIVGHANQRTTAFFDPDRNLIGACVQRILNQLFNYRSRPLDDFAGRYLVGESRRQEMDAGHAMT